MKFTEDEDDKLNPVVLLAKHCLKSTGMNTNFRTCCIIWQDQLGLYMWGRENVGNNWGTLCQIVLLWACWLLQMEESIWYSKKWFSGKITNFSVEIQTGQFWVLLVCPILLFLVCFGPRSRTATLTVTSWKGDRLNNVVTIYFSYKGKRAQRPKQWTRSQCLGWNRCV